MAEAYPPTSRVTALKIDEPADRAGVVYSNIILPEDAFTSMYIGGAGRGNVVPPPYNLSALAKLVVENNALPQCIAAMEVNIDGTGYDIEPWDEKKETDDDVEKDYLLKFFEEPWPGQSFITQRRQLRRDQEETGNAYLEVIRNPAGDIIFLRPLPSVTVRLCKLSEQVPVKKTVTRFGKPATVTVMLRERAFVQQVGEKFVYFREYGTSRDIDKTNGQWAEKGAKLPANKRGSELIHFKAVTSSNTPYGIPRWINQTPSVVGSRKAEEYNLDFFDAGGIPPILIFLSNGMMQDQTRKQIEGILKADPKHKNRGAVVEVMPVGGSIDKESRAEIKVERFGAERQQDSMFEKYDERCEMRVRSAFRIPPLFMGKSGDYNYATAYVSYTIAEVQVFQPERLEFDEVINTTIMKELNPKYYLRSLGLNIKDIEHQLTALGLAQGKVDNENFIEAINEVAGLNLKHIDPPELPETPEEGEGGGGNR